MAPPGYRLHKSANQVRYFSLLSRSPSQLWYSFPMDEKVLKSHLRTIYDQLRNQQELIGRLWASQKEMLEALQSELPEFEGTFELEKRSADVVQEQKENDRVLELIDARIQELSED